MIGTEYEPVKAAAARASIAEAGLSKYVELREGDLRQTLKNLEGPIDFVLLDIWIEMVEPALELIAPHLRKGALLVADNTESFRKQYKPLFDFIDDPRNGLASRTLPYAGGLELIVKLR